MKTTLLPSGVKTGAPWPPGGSPGRVRRRGTPPSTGTAKSVAGECAAIAEGPSGTCESEEKTTSLPSGEKAGSAPKSTSCLAVPPSAGMIQTPPLLSEWYAMRAPSGDHEGWTLRSSPDVRAIERPPGASCLTKSEKPPASSEE